MLNGANCTNITDRGDQEMIKDNGSEPAKPVTITEYTPNGYECVTEFLGLTKREYFAAMTLQGLSLSGDTAEDIAKQAVDLADALLSELEETR